MTDFSQLPQLNSVAPLREKPWLRWPSRGAVARFGLVGLSWFNVVMLSLCLLSHFERLGTPGPRLVFQMWERFAVRVPSFVVAEIHCGNQLPPSLESQSLFVAVNLGIWVLFSRLSLRPNQIARAKLPALVAVILWCGIGGGILVGKSLPNPELQHAHPRKL